MVSAGVGSLGGANLPQPSTNIRNSETYSSTRILRSTFTFDLMISRTKYHVDQMHCTFHRHAIPCSLSSTRVTPLTKYVCTWCLTTSRGFLFVHWIFVDAQSDHRPLEEPTGDINLAHSDNATFSIVQDSVYHHLWEYASGLVW